MNGRRLAFLFLFAAFLTPWLEAQTDPARARIALFEPLTQKNDPALASALTTVADSVELSLDLLGLYEVRRLPSADPQNDLARVKAYCQDNRIDQAIMGSGGAKAGGGYLFKLEVYDRRSDSITLAPEGSSAGALDMFDVTDRLVSELLDGLSGTHLLFGSLSVESDPAGATVAVNGKEVGTAPVSLRGLPAGVVQVSAKLAGHEEVNASLTIVDGGSTDAPLSLARSTGTLALTVPKDAQVTVSSAEIGKKDIAGPGAETLPTGDYDLQASSPGMPPVTGRLTIARGTRTPWLPWPKGYLDVQAVPAGATVVVDGVSRGAAPLVVEVEPGPPHHVVLRLQNYEPYATDVSAAAGDKARVAPALVGLPASIRVETSIAGASVQLDNGLSGKTPFLFERVQPGRHVVRIANLRVGNSLFVAGDPSQVEVGPGGTALLSKTLVAGKATLKIADAPEGSVVLVDGKEVDSGKAITSGIEVTAGWMDVAVQSPILQKWTGSSFLGPGTTNQLSIYSMTWQIPRRTISMKGREEDWAGLSPFWISILNAKDWGNQPGTVIKSGYACRDDRFLYFKYDFANGSPRKELSGDIKELDYVQIIFTKAGQLTLITRFAAAALGASQKFDVGIRGDGNKPWTSLSSSQSIFTIGDGTLEIAVPLDLIKRSIKQEPVPAGIFVVDSIESGSDSTSFSALNGTKTRAIDFGL